jgi:uncharacterized protein YndB with AHSA1/START domain
MTDTTDTHFLVSTETTQVYRVFIKASPQAIWDAITRPEWTEQYNYNSRVEYDLRPGGAFAGYPGEAVVQGSKEMGYPVPDVMVDGEVIEADPPNKLVQTWRLAMDEGMKAEGFTRLTWEIEAMDENVSRLTVVHELEGAPKTALMVAGGHAHEGAGGGWSEVLSGLKTLLETGQPLGTR